MKSFFIHFFFFLVAMSFSLESQAQLNQYAFDKTNIVIELPSSFAKNTNEDMGGYKNKNYTCIITGLQFKIDKPISFLSKIQAEKLKSLGMPIRKKSSFKYGNYQAILFDYKPNIDTMDAFVLIFGDNKTQNIITAIYHPKYKEEVRTILLTCEMDTNIYTSYALPSGFSAISSSGALNKIYSTDSYLRYDSMDGNLALFLNKIAKEDFNEKNAQDYIDYIQFNYYPLRTIYSEDRFVINNGTIGYGKTFKAVGYPESRFDYIAVIEFENFNLLIRGMVKDLKNMKYLRKVIQTINIE